MKIKNSQIKRVVKLSELNLLDTFICKKNYDFSPNLSQEINVVIDIDYFDMVKVEIKSLCYGHVSSGNRATFNTSNNMDCLVYLVEISGIDYSFCGEEPESDD